MGGWKANARGATSWWARLSSSGPSVTGEKGVDSIVVRRDTFGTLVGTPPRSLAGRGTVLVCILIGITRGWEYSWQPTSAPSTVEQDVRHG